MTIKLNEEEFDAVFGALKQIKLLAAGATDDAEKGEVDLVLENAYEIGGEVERLIAVLEGADSE